MKAVNYLSTEFIVRSVRDGEARKVTFSQGIMLSDERESGVKEKNGTFVSFVPDPEIFPNYQFNIDYIEQFLATSLPQVGMIRPQASYLVFLDFRQLGLTQQELGTLIVDRAHLALNDGAMFGKEGTGFMRLNAASPRSVIAEAMHRLQEAIG